MVTAIKETLDKSNIGDLKVGDLVNLERSMKLQQRLDGHMVQGHVDQTGICTLVSEVEGSTYFSFKYDDDYSNITIEKGSITVNSFFLESTTVKLTPFTLKYLVIVF